MVHAKPYCEPSDKYEDWKEEEEKEMEKTYSSTPSRWKDWEYEDGKEKDIIQLTEGEVKDIISHTDLVNLLHKEDITKAIPIITEELNKVLREKQS